MPKVGSTYPRAGLSRPGSQLSRIPENLTYNTDTTELTHYSWLVHLSCFKINRFIYSLIKHPFRVAVLSGRFAFALFFGFGILVVVVE